MKLDRKYGLLKMAKTSHRVIVEVDVGHLAPRGGQTHLIDTEAVVLACDLHPSSLEV